MRKGHCEVAIVCFELHSMPRNEFAVTKTTVYGPDAHSVPPISPSHRQGGTLYVQMEGSFKKSIKTVYGKHCVKIVMTVVAYHLHKPAPGLKSCA